MKRNPYDSDEYRADPDRYLAQRDGKCCTICVCSFCLFFIILILFTLWVGSVIP